MADLAALIARVEAASGPERDLDLAIGLALAGWTDHGHGLIYDEDGYMFPSHLGPSYPNYTASIDAALALVERKLGKHWCWQIKSAIQHQCILWTLETDWDDRTPPTGYHVTAPLAIIVALLKAIAEGHAQ